MPDPYANLGTRVTPQSQPIPGRTDQVPNSAGGFAFPVDDWTRLHRFLILGSEGGTYYTSEPKLTRENADALFRCLDADGNRVVHMILNISTHGRNAKQQPLIWAFAAACAHPSSKRFALDSLPYVCRTGTHLLMFAGYVEQFRGWGRSLRQAVAKWYDAKDVDQLAYQAVKYKQRGGWSQRDLLRLAHPATTDPARNDLYRWIAGKESPSVPALVFAHEEVMKATSPRAVGDLIRRYPNLPWEALPAEHLGSPLVWEALLPNLPLGALVRNLGRMSANGLLVPFSDATRTVVARLADGAAIRKARLHPIAVLSAMITYGSGRGVRGSLSWTPIPQVVDALDGAFYESFGAVTPTGKRTLLALDVSGSMSSGVVAGVPGLTPRVASAAMAMVTARTEQDWMVLAFTGGEPPAIAPTPRPRGSVGYFTTYDQFGRPTIQYGATSFGSSVNVAYGRTDAVTPLDFSSRERLDDICRRTDGLPFGRTDCALPMLWALKEKVNVDTFVIYTDSETWAGAVHPTQALEQYRQQSGIAARSVVVGMVSNGFSIADPRDGGQLDVVGFDTAAPELISAFSRGEV